MDSRTYLKQSERTVSCVYTSIEHRLQGSFKFDLLHAAIGLATEAGEFQDALKKHIFYGKELDTVNLREELGDILWYVALALRTLDSDFETEMRINIEKLQARFPSKFTEEDAEVRDLVKEREILEQ